LTHIQGGSIKIQFPYIKHKTPKVIQPKKKIERIRKTKRGKMKKKEKEKKKRKRRRSSYIK